MYKQKAQVAAEFLMLVVFGFVIISLVMYGVSYYVINLNQQQEQNTLDDLAESILSEFDTAQKTQGGYSREIIIEPFLINQYNVSLNSTSRYLTLQNKYGTNPDKKHYYLIENAINFTYEINSSNFGIINIEKQSEMDSSNSVTNRLNLVGNKSIENSMIISPFLSGYSGYAYGENIGYISFNGSNYGVDTTGNSLTGYAYGENIGYISFNGSNYGVNIVGNNLTGYAYGENIGYISFNGSNYGVDSAGSSLTGYAYGENIGYISFNGSNYGVETN